MQNIKVVNASSRNGRFFTLPKFYYSCIIGMYYIIEVFWKKMEIL